MPQKSEFASLTDLALKQGIPHSELIAEIHERILVEYKRLYPKAKTAEVVVNEKTGEVSLMRDRQDVTPQEFIPFAEKVAREVVIEKLNTGKSDVSDYIKEKVQVIPSKDSNFEGLGRWIINIIFWGYNFLYLFILIIFLGNFLINKEYREDLLELSTELGVFRTLFIGIAAVVPLITIITALKLHRKKLYDKLGTLFFLFEVPLVIVPLFFVNVFSNPTPVMWFFMAIFLFAIPLFFMHILDIQTETRELKIAVTFLKETTLISVGYATLLFSFVSPLILGIIVKMISEFFVDEVFGLSGAASYSYFNPFELLITLFFGGLFILILFSLTVAPYILLLSLIKVFLKSRESLSETLGRLKADKLIAVFAVVWLLFFLGLSYQPNADKYIQNLERFGQATTFEEKEKIAVELMPEESKIKRAFEDLKNVRSRYLMAKSDDYIKEAYIDVLNFNSLSAELVQQSFMAFAYPFVYQGSLDRSQMALRSFEYLFGKDLYSYPASPEVKNAEVLERTVDVKTDYDGLIATITITEEYSNTTFRDQEVIYEFSLPPDSVVTDLKLGPDLEFPGLIAPKGAAARVYQQELNRQRDPALLEQTGPSQYRLRIFPIPAKNSGIISGKNQKVQFSYIAPLGFKGFGLPVYTKEQNVKSGVAAYFVNGETASIDGKYVKSAGQGDLCSKKDAITARTKLASASGYLIPVAGVAGDLTSCDSNGVSLANSARNLKIAFVFDVSYTNKDSRLVAETKQILKDNPALVEQNILEVYKFNDMLSGGSVVKDASNKSLDFTFFGTRNWPKALQGLAGAYDFAVVLTNDEEPPLAQSLTIKKDFPLYIVHAGSLPPYSTAVTAEVFQSGGASYTSVTEALNAGIVESMHKKSDNKELIYAGPIFSYYTDTAVSQLIGSDWLNIQSESDPLAKIITKKLTERKLNEQGGTLEGQVQFLDLLHKFAANNSVVTPYSSLIALVNERQLQNLKQQAQNFDRYKEQSSGGSTINLAPGGQFRGLGSTFFGVDTLNMAIPPGGGGGIGAPSGAVMMDGGGTGFGLSGLYLIILANGLILGLGIAVYVFVRIKKALKERKAKISS